MIACWMEMRVICNGSVESVVKMVEGGLAMIISFGIEVWNDEVFRWIRCHIEGDIDG